MSAKYTVSEEGALPTEPQKQESETYQNARLWVQIDGAVHELKQSVKDLKEWVAGKLKLRMENARGPDPDYDPSDQILRDLHRAITNLNRPSSNHNGDEGSIKPWHLVMSIVGLMLTIMWMTYLLSSQVESESTKIDSVLERLKSQDDRINRIEQQYEERSRAPSS